MKRREFFTAVALYYASSAMCIYAGEKGKLSLFEQLAKARKDGSGESLQAAFDSIQLAADKVTPQDYRAHWGIDAEEAKRHGDEFGIFKFLDESFDHTICDLKKSAPKDGEVFIWHVYNMGYIVKTPTSTFGIDICHPRAKVLAPLLDFMLITHNHRDHYSSELIEVMRNKPIVSNFIKNDYMSKSVRKYKFGDISISASPCDHNAKHLNFVLNYEIDCGAVASNCLIYHVGDACNYRQLTPSRAPDIFIPHLAVGLDIGKCDSVSVKPKNTFISHILELGHPIDKYRWPISLGVKMCVECKNSKAYLPLWGDKFTWSSKRNVILT